MLRNLLPLALLSLALSACQTIYFVKGESRSTELSTGQWHHGGGIFGLFEFSPPYAPSEKCGNSGWEAVVVDHTFASALVSGLVPYGIYTPWAVSTRCSNAASASLSEVALKGPLLVR